MAGPFIPCEVRAQTGPAWATTPAVARKLVYRDVMTASRRHDTTGRDGPLCHDTIGSA